MTTEAPTTPDHPTRERGTRSRCKVLSDRRKVLVTRKEYLEARIAKHPDRSSFERAESSALATAIELIDAELARETAANKTRTASAQDRTQEPKGWTLRQLHEDPREPGTQWQCLRDDERLFAYGKTPEETIAAAWREVDMRDLHAVGARLYVAEQLHLRNAHGNGLVLVTAERSIPAPDEEPGWCVSILTSFGVNHCGLVALERDAAQQGDDFGLTFPDCNQCDALCRIVYESDQREEGTGRLIAEGGPYLEIIDIDGKPAIEIWDP